MSATTTSAPPRDGAKDEACTVQEPHGDSIRVVLSLSPDQYEEMGRDLEAIRRRLDLPGSASNTQVIVKAVRHLADGE